MSQHDEPELTARQELVTEVLLGIRSRTDPKVIAASTDPSFTAMLEALAAVQQQLDRTAAAEREAGQEPRLPRDARLGRLVQRRLRPRRRWTLALGLAAVAALVLVGVRLWGRDTPGTPRYERLNGDGKVTCEPEYARLRWEIVPGARRYQVRVRTPGSDGSLREVESSPMLYGTEWQPERAAEYGPWIEVQVVVPGVEEDRIVHTAEFWRSGQRR